MNWMFRTQDIIFSKSWWCRYSLFFKYKIILHKKLNYIMYASSVLLFIIWVIFSHLNINFFIPFLFYPIHSHMHVWPSFHLFKPIILFLFSTSLHHHFSPNFLLSFSFPFFLLYILPSFLCFFLPFYLSLLFVDSPIIIHRSSSSHKIPLK